MSGSSRQTAFRPDIEGLRGIAVLMVVAFHCGVTWLRGGFVGVDVFFVLSGYLITRLLASEIQKTGRISLLNFYARRVRRLLPASALMLFVALLAGLLLLAPREIAFAGRAGRATALYMSNVFFGLNAADYFAPDVESNPLLHTWSLAVEEQFYLFWPLLVMFGLQFLRSRRALLGVLASLTAVSFSICVWSTWRSGTFAFYQLPARAWEFGVGGVAGLLPAAFLERRPALCSLLSWSGIVGVVASGCWIGSASNFPGWVAAAPVLATVLVLVAASCHPDAGAGPVLNSGPLQAMGTLSYSWYLWHWPFLVLSIALFPTISAPGKVAVALFALVVSAVTHRLVENPIRFHPYLMKRPALCLSLAAGLTLISLSVSMASIRLSARMENAPAMKTLEAAVDDIADMPRQQCVSLGDSPEVKTCVFGNPAAGGGIALFGDSHAIQWFDALRRIAEKQGWKLTTFVKSGCPAADIATPGPGASFTPACSAWRSEAIREIVALRPTVVLVASSIAYIRGNWPGRREDRGVSLEEWREGTQRTYEALTAGGIQVVAMRDNPRYPFDVPTCVARSVRHSRIFPTACVAAESEVVDPSVFATEKAAAQTSRNVHFIDMTGQFCRGAVCSPVLDGVPLYRDDNHLTGAFAARLAPLLAANLAPILTR